MTDNSVLQVY